MAKSIHRVTVCRALAIGSALSWLVFSGTTRAQSPTVFMTTAMPTLLYRFDDGAQTFGVGTGGDSAFHGVTIHNGSILVADFRAEAIQRFSPNGTLLSPFALFSNPTFLESDSSGNVYTTHFSIGPAVATRFDSAGAVTMTFTVPGATSLSGVDADAAGNVYVVNHSGGMIFKFAPDGTLLNGTPAGGFLDDVAIDEAGARLFVANEFGGANGIQVYDISGAAPTFIGNFPTPVGTNIVGVHFASESGNILATDFGPLSRDPRGLEFSSGGTLLREYRPAAAQLALDITTFVVPEPNSLVLIILGMVSLEFGVRGGSRRRGVSS